MGMGIRSSSMSPAGGAAVYQQQRQQFSQLSQALQSGNLSSAQSAFSALAAKSPSASNPNSPMSQLGQALKAGNVSAAQQIFTSFRTGGHQAPQTATNASSTAPSTTLATSGSVGTLLNALA